MCAGKKMRKVIKEGMKKAEAGGPSTGKYVIRFIKLIAFSSKLNVSRDVTHQVAWIGEKEKRAMMRSFERPLLSYIRFFRRGAR